MVVEDALEFGLEDSEPFFVSSSILRLELKDLFPFLREGVVLLSEFSSSQTLFDLIGGKEANPLLARRSALLSDVGIFL